MSIAAWILIAVLTLLACATTALSYLVAGRLKYLYRAAVVCTAHVMSAVHKVDSSYVKLKSSPPGYHGGTGSPGA